MTRTTLWLSAGLAALAVGCNGDKSNGGVSVTSPSTPTKIIALSGNLAFGDVPVGSTKESLLSISNAGTAILTISGITVSSGLGPVFTTSVTSGTVGAGSSINAIIRFAPASTTPYSGTVTVLADQSSGTNTIAVSGSGTQAAPPPTPACDVVLSPATLTIGASGSSAKATVQVSVARGCAWSVSTRDSWLIARPTSGSDNGTFEIEGLDFSGTTRSTQITVGNAVANVTQSSGTPSPGTQSTPNITIGRFSNGAPPSPGQGMVWTSYFEGTVLSAQSSVYVVDINYAPVGCSIGWTAVSADTSAVQLSPARGTGNGQVELFMPANSGARRSTLVTIAGQTTSITQAGRLPLAPTMTP